MSYLTENFPKAVDKNFALKTVYEYLEFVKTKEDADFLLDFFEKDRNRLLNFIGYHAGRMSHDERKRLENLFDCEHPVFGKIVEMGPPTPEEAFTLGTNLATKNGPQTLKELRNDTERIRRESRKNRTTQ